ncbi:ParB/RepB/Spo0J family partition protein [Curtobacterium sp. VKM Ac-1395]|uniref:ParB/RepB/Spo0J family partition protein n=1 Tax=Curtobacterium sp. VKM Ac-1395 TaxID=2783815 RepID=UPI00188CD398|nr:ParB N-terminal domain-containing protein [Curtobacterium sp. VKM Ac-1395]MBF4592106.1 ParB N-terminal domain-containing protein [Curtobacterium sp. VKM Ac-1395]
MTITDNVHFTHLTDTPEADQPTPEATPATDGVELVTLPALNVSIENNVRTAADLDPAFLASVKQHGVLLPTIGYRDQDGRVVVRDGQMRVLAAIEAGCDVPVFVTARDDNTAKRIAEQLVANERRTALTDGDRLAAYRQLEIEGLSVTAIAKETGTKRDTVKATLAVAKSEAATKAVTDSALTLDDALLFAEFQDDPEAIAELQGCVDEGYADELKFTAERIRQDRQGKADMARIAGEWEAKGVRVVTSEDDYTTLSSLTDANDDAEDRPVLDAEAHATGCAGHAVFLQAWGEHTAVAVCTTPVAHHVKYPRYSFSTAPAAELTEEEVAEQKEAEKAARRELIANNKAWDAADTLRIEFVKSLLQRKTLPKDWTMFAAVAGTRHGWTMRADNSGGVRDLLSIESGSGYGADTVATWVEQHPAKAPHVALAVVLSAFENAANREWWRRPATEGAAYLNQLAAWGHRLTDVEKIAAGIQPEPVDSVEDADTAAE